MDLTKLFETQAALDEHIMQEHPELRGKDNLDWKILALQVELGECANEWRAFKKWSKDQEPRVWKRINCPSCEKKGYERGKTPVDPVKGIHALGNHWYYCDECAGHLVIDINPMLIEYVDCLHFILSIGLEKGFNKMNHNLAAVEGLKQNNINTQFNYLFTKIGDFNSVRNHNNYMYIVPLFIGLGEMLGFTWEQIVDAYYAKNKVNHERQETGY